jgi:hypothetical protein
MACPRFAPTCTDHFRWLVGRTADGHAAEVNELEAALLEHAGLVGLVEALEDDVELGRHAPPYHDW